jgi:gluconolactonase
MAYETYDTEVVGSLSRRKMLQSANVAIGAALLGPRLTSAQTRPIGPVTPPSTITQPPRDFSSRGAPTTYFTDPDVLTIEPAFDGLRQPNAPIQRLWTGAL